MMVPSSLQVKKNKPDSRLSSRPVFPEALEDGSIEAIEFCVS